MKLSKIDRKILIDLLENGRQSASDMGRALGSQRQNVHNRIRKMRDEGIIRRFTVVLDGKKLLGALDLSMAAPIKAYILVHTNTSLFRSKVENEFGSLPQVSSACYLFGRYDILLEVIVRDNEELTNFIKKIQAIAKKGGVPIRTETFVAFDEFKEDPRSPFLGYLK